ncbi:acyltransferase family protein [Variovorax rhizosphaerae]|uniref:Acyltransferase family protein n=1 Tax=Variovorax rhizosphaerae TaxID=1836200 RepID=A0ABU8WS15_9BURK
MAAADALQSLTTAPASALSPASRFRADVNGLRAWAVIAVMLYHFDVPGLGGGFIGVDVFYVISGFLMTGIVVRGLESPRGFSLVAFYLARGRRILPALVGLCTALLLVGWFVMSTIDYRLLGKHVAFALTFLSNHQFWREAGYFDVSSHDKWLLHTWSLAVEWQFYVLLPLALMGAWKIRPGRTLLTLLMAAGLVASLGWAQILAARDPGAAFYLLPARAWEMLAGGLVFLFPQATPGSGRLGLAMELAGLGLIVAAALFLNALPSSQGWRGLLPVCGTVMVLVAARAQSPWTGNVLVQWLGTRSYSLYLWHWPVVVGLLYLEWPGGAATTSFGLASTVVLGAVAYRVVEAPARRHLRKLPLPASLALLMVATAAVALPSRWVWTRDGVPGRLGERIDNVAEQSTNRKPNQYSCLTMSGVSSPSCMFGGQRLTAIVLGDSHADAVTTAVAAAVAHDGDGVMDWSYSGCPNIFGVKKVPGLAPLTEDCEGFMHWAVNKLAQVPSNVPLVLVSRTSFYAMGRDESWRPDAHIPLVYFDRPHEHPDEDFLSDFSHRLTDSACALAKDHPVYLMRPIPEMGIDVPRQVARAMALGRDKGVSVSLDEYRKRHAMVLAAQDAAHDQCGVKILDPLPYLCPDGRCESMRGGRPIYYDDNHLSEYGNKFLVPMFAEVFRTQG